MADTRDLKSLVKYLTCGFESRLRHFLIRLKPYASKFNAFCFMSVLNDEYWFVKYVRFVKSVLIRLIRV